MNKTMSPEEHYKSVLIKYLSNRFPKVNKYMRFEFSKIFICGQHVTQLDTYYKYKPIATFYFSDSYDSMFTPLNEICLMIFST